MIEYIKNCHHCKAPEVPSDDSLEDFHLYMCGRHIKWNEHDDAWDLLVQCPTAEEPNTP
jgi:hypothetical protein